MVWNSSFEHYYPRAQFLFLILMIGILAGKGDKASASALQDPGKASPQAREQQANDLARQAVAAFQANDCPSAIKLFHEVTILNPGDIVAFNISANCSIRLKDYPGAIDAFKHALQIQPDEWHNLSGLMRAYTLAGMTRERDELEKHISELERGGKLPDTFSFVFDSFQVADKQVEVSKYLKITGFYGERYRFNVHNKDGTLVFRVALESAQMEQPQWAKEHQELAAAGGRKFSLDGYSPEEHFTYGFYDGEPEYPTIRREAEQVLTGKKKAISHGTADKLR
jgi:tetratricopeptide (TPR) repeat protein